VAAELPLEVIAELLGVPREDRQKLFERTKHRSRNGGRGRT
jgi:cytochrome P450